jgi:Xaa-Pro aminopeptidase
VEFGALTVDRFRALERGMTGWTFEDVTSIMNGLRAVKDETEQQAFRRAAELMGFALRATTAGLAAGMSELEIKGRFDSELYAEAARRWPDAMAAAGTNVLSGERLNRLHDAAHGRRVGAGEPVWILSHAHWNGYWANISRNVFVPGATPDPNVARAHQAVIEAQRAAIERLVPGRPLGEASKAADDALARHGLLDKKMYGVFRGLGLRYDELPRPTDLDTILAAGMCICVQLHVRLPNLIVGQGDSILITARGPEIVSQS